MSDSLHALEYLEKPYKLYKADSGAVRFRITQVRAVPKLLLLDKECPHEALYRIILYHDIVSFHDLKHSDDHLTFTIPHSNDDTREFWLTWFNDAICMGRINDENGFLHYSELNRNEGKQVIGFIKFHTSSNNGRGLVEWSFESPPVMSASVPKPVSGGKLRWVKMTTGDLLPIDAMIGGFENEPLYIARALHRGSLCPGKYVKSEQEAYVAWGGQECPKNEFEILCGYDASWVKCFDNRIPENAFIAGTSEVRNEPLFIGRAQIQNDLIPGKVHMLYKTCYLPYKGREVERGVYEILVTNKPLRGKTCDHLCYMKMNMQPCIGPTPNTHAEESPF
ncbi:uncharacterized protein [Epargyreus clarus]|uniref:uncharacterized protein n=1 Tax=Epargyreus clarus TaxID=520877 RepID=UPI003C2B84A0